MRNESGSINMRNYAIYWEACNKWITLRDIGRSATVSMLKDLFDVSKVIKSEYKKLQRMLNIGCISDLCNTRLRNYEEVTAIL